VTLAQQEWEAADAQCKSGGGGGSQGSEFITTAKVMNATATAHDMTWNLDTELASGTGSTGGAQLIVAVIEAASPNGTPVYYFSNPRLKGGTKTVSISGGIMVRINGQEQVLGSTWSRVDNSAAPGATTVLSTAQMLIEYPSFMSSDTLSLSIESITAQ
jgi:hypothetical protein